MNTNENQPPTTAEIVAELRWGDTAENLFATGHNYFASILAAADRLEAQERELQELRKDKERLDRLEQLAAIQGRTSWYVHVNGYGYLHIATLPPRNGVDLRTAIDNAVIYESASNGNPRVAQRADAAREAGR